MVYRWLGRTLVVVWEDFRRCLSRWNTLSYVLHLHGSLLVVYDCPSLNRVLKVLTVVALAMGWAQNAWLETFAVFLKAGRFLASTALGVLLFLTSSGLRTSFNHLALAHAARSRLYLSLVSSQLGSFSCWLLIVRIDLWPERVGSLIKGLLNGVLSDTLKERIVLAWVAVTMIGYAIQPGSEALTVELEATRIATVASLASGGRSCCWTFRHNGAGCRWDLTLINSLLSLLRLSALHGKLRFGGILSLILVLPDLPFFWEFARVLWLLNAIQFWPIVLLLYLLWRWALSSWLSIVILRNLVLTPVWATFGVPGIILLLSWLSIILVHLSWGLFWRSIDRSYPTLRMTAFLNVLLPAVLLLRIFIYRNAITNSIRSSLENGRILIRGEIILVLTYLSRTCPFDVLCLMWTAITLSHVFTSLLLKLLVGEDSSFVVLDSEAFDCRFWLRCWRLLDLGLLLSLFAHVKCLKLDDVTSRARVVHHRLLDSTGMTIAGGVEPSDLLKSWAYACLGILTLTHHSGLHLL